MMCKAILTCLFIALVISVALLDGAVECSTQVKQMLQKCEQLQVSPGIQSLLF
jgi:hypothetical protein